MLSAWSDECHTSHPSHCSTCSQLITKTNSLQRVSLSFLKFDESKWETQERQWCKDKRHFLWATLAVEVALASDVCIESQECALVLSELVSQSPSLTLAVYLVYANVSCSVCSSVSSSLCQCLWMSSNVYAFNVVPTVRETQCERTPEINS